MSTSRENTPVFPFVSPSRTQKLDAQAIFEKRYTNVVGFHKNFRLPIIENDKV
jgi:hypothetical protein